eukprot:gene4969-6952_t
MAARIHVSDQPSSPINSPASSSYANSPNTIMDINQGASNKAVLDTSNNVPREMKYSQVNYLLFFEDRNDEKLYMQSLKNSFHFPTFWPMIALFISFIIVLTTRSSSTYETQSPVDYLYALSGAMGIILILIFICAQAIKYIQLKTHYITSVIILKISDFILKKLFWGHIEDTILLCSTFAAGFYLLSIVLGDYCSDNKGLIQVVKCSSLTVSRRYFPYNQIFFGYVAILILPIYFKSMKRHFVLLNWFIYTVFVITAYAIGQYVFQVSIVLLCLFFFVSLYEYERYKMTAYLLSKQALIYEQSKLALIAEKSKVIERKLNLALVHQILPPKVAEAIRQGRQVPPEQFDEVTIFFSDVVGFTTICSQVSPIEVVRMLNELYTVMDYCTSHFPLYKVETIGDAYMVVGGLPTRDPKHAQYIADFAVLVRHAVQSVKSPIDGSPINIRIGLHSGAVMAGVVGNLMPRYCLFGDTVNTASRMESNGLAGKIHISATTAKILIEGGKHVVNKRGDIEIKGKGVMSTYWLDAATPDNDNSNEVAIERLQNMVTDILAESYEESFSNDNAHTSSLNSSFNIFSDLTNGTSNPNTSNNTTRNTSYHKNNGSGSFNQNNNSSHPSGLLNGFSLGLNNSNSKYSSRINRSGGIGLRDNQFGLQSSTGAKMLVVEDSPAQRKILIHRLNKADASWDISFATSGEDALQKLKAAKLMFDVVFVDENLSTNDGLFGHELVQVMREQFQMSRCVIIACTSNPAKVKDELIAAGVDFVWPKPPPSPMVIKSKIDSLIQMRMRYNSGNDDKV